MENRRAETCFVDDLELYKTVATSHTWLFKFKLIEIKLRI